jgi:hypothetical protein
MGTAHMEEEEEEKKDEHPSPFAPYRSRWLGLISKNNMWTDEAPPLAKPSGGAKYVYRWGTLNFTSFSSLQKWGSKQPAKKPLENKKRKSISLGYVDEKTITVW